MVESLVRDRADLYFAQLKPAMWSALAKTPIAQFVAQTLRCFGPRKGPGHRSFRDIPRIKRSRCPARHVEETARLDPAHAERYAKEVGLVKGIGMLTAPELERQLHVVFARMDLTDFRATPLGTRLVETNRAAVEDGLCRNVAESATTLMGRLPGSEMFALRNDKRPILVRATLLRALSGARRMAFAGRELIESGLALGRSVRSGTDASNLADCTRPARSRRYRVAFPERFKKGSSNSTAIPGVLSRAANPESKTSRGERENVSAHSEVGEEHGPSLEGEEGTMHNPFFARDVNPLVNKRKGKGM